MKAHYPQNKTTLPERHEGYHKTLPVRALLILLSLLAAFCSPAQKYNFITYNSKSGLANNDVRGIFQSADGSVYVTGTSGISIFDGFRFKNFGYKDGIYNDYIKHIIQSDSGNIYLFSNTTPNVYVFRNNMYKYILSSPRIVSDHYKNATGESIVSTAAGLFVFANNTFTKKEISDDTSRLGRSYYKYVELNDSISVASRSFPTNQLVLINRRQRKVIHKIDNFLCYHLFRDSRGRVWICTDHLGPVMIDSESLKTPSDLFRNTPDCLRNLEGIVANYATEDNKGNIWIGTIGKGLIKLGPGNTCKSFTVDNGLLSNAVFKLFVDRNNDLWIGTMNGLQLLTDENIVTYTKSNGLPENEVYAASLVDSGTLLAATVKDVAVIDTRTDRVQAHPLPHPEEGYIFRLQDGPNGKLWGMTSWRMYLLQPAGGKFYYKVFPKVPEFLRDIVSLPDGTCMAVSTNNIYRFSLRGYDTLAKGFDGIKSMSLDKSNHLYIASTAGISVFRIQSNADKLQLIPISVPSAVFAKETIVAIAADKRGRIWVGTSQNGIFLVELKNSQLQILQNINRSNGLSNNAIKSLKFYDDSTIYCSTLSGTDRMILSRSTDTVEKIVNIPDLPPGSFSISRNENLRALLFSSLNGLTIFSDPLETSLSKTWATSFTELQVNGKETDSLLALPSFSLMHYENDLLFYFSNFSYTPKRYRFWYWLQDGQNEHWKEVVHNNFIQFNQLSPGNYTLHLRTYVEDARYPISEITKNFIIKEVWYQTRLFRSLLAIGFLSLLFFLIRLRISAIRKKAGIRNQISEIKMAALKAQMNPHFIFNCINSIDAFIQSNDKYNATVYLNKFARLIRNVLDNSRDNTVSFTKDMETLNLYLDLEKLRSGHRFSVQIKMDEELLENDFQIPPLIVQPFVENAILHGLKNRPGNDGKLMITIAKTGNYLKYEIEDNGIGRAAADMLNKGKYKSHGTQMSFDRVRIFNNEEEPSITITDLADDKGPSGTKVTVKLKIL